LVKQMLGKWKGLPNPNHTEIVMQNPQAASKDKGGAK